MLKTVVFPMMTFLLGSTLMAQEIRIERKAPVSQVYKETVEAESILSFNDLNVEFG